MAYIGNPVDTAFTSLLKQDLTGASGTTLTLSHAVANENDIALYINNVRQEPISAYTVSNVTVNLTGTVSGTDDIYVIYLARAIQTTVPPDGSVSTAKIADGSVSTAKIADSAVTASKVDSTLNLSTIKDSTGNNTGMSINSSGYVTQPNKPFVSAAATNATVAGVSGSLKYTTYETSNHNLVSGGHLIIYKNDFNMLNTTTGIVTVPVTGVYLIVGHYSHSSATSGRRIGHYYVNNNMYGEWLESFGQYEDQSAVKLLSLSANDTVQFGKNASLGYADFGFEMVLIG